MAAAAAPFIPPIIEAAAEACAALLAAMGIGVAWSKATQQVKSNEEAAKEVAASAEKAGAEFPPTDPKQVEEKCNKQGPRRLADYDAKSDKHVSDEGHADDGAPPKVDQKATTKAGKTKYKSKFGKGEGGQPFTDEVMNHPKVRTRDQGDGRTAHEVADMGRVTGTGQDGQPVKGGRVVVEWPDVSPTSDPPTGRVVTQHPL